MQLREVPILIFAIVAITGTSAQAQPELPPEQIAYREIGAHGSEGFSWFLHSNGRGMFRDDRPDAVTPQAAIAVGNEGFEQIATLLHPLENQHVVQCELDSTDQSMGIVTWVRGIQHVSVHIDFGCRPAAAEQAFWLVEQANALIAGHVGASQANDPSLPDNPGPGIMPEGRELLAR